MKASAMRQKDKKKTQFEAVEVICEQPTTNVMCFDMIHLQLCHSLGTICCRKVY